MNIRVATSWAILAAAAVLLSGCGGPTSVGPPYRRAATWSVMTAATARGPMLVNVLGDPFHIGPSAFGNIVAEDMSGQVLSRPFRFTPDSARAADPNIRVVVAFNPAITASGTDLCRGSASAAASPQPGRVTVLAAFCDRAEEMSSVRGGTDLSGPQDRRLRMLLGQMTRQLFGENTEMLKSGPDGGIR